MNKKPIHIKMDIDEDMKFSLNRIWAWWAGTQWIRKAKRDLWHDVVSENIKLKKIDYPIEIDYKFFFKSRYLDCSNNALHVKLFEDAIVAEWIIDDDTNQYIRKFSVEVPIIEPKERKAMSWDYMLITIKPYE